MVDSTTIGLVFVTKDEKISSADENKIRTIKSAKGHNHSVWLDYLGHFDMYGESTISIRVDSVLPKEDEEKIYFEGDGDMQVFHKANFTTPHTIIETIWPAPQTRIGTCFSIKDLSDDDSACIVAASNHIQYWAKRGYSLDRMPRRIKKYLSDRAEKFARSELTRDLFPVGTLTPSQLVREIGNWYGLDSCILDPQVDTTEIGGLYCGAMSRGLSLVVLLEILECDEFHYELIDNKLSVWALPAYYHYHRGGVKGKNICTGI